MRGMTETPEGLPASGSTSADWLVVVNGARATQGVMKRLSYGCIRAGLKAQFKQTMHPGHAGELVQRALQNGAQQIAIAGGDGSVNDAIQGLFAWAGDTRTVRMGLIPMGTGNDIARGLGIPLRMEQSLGLLAGNQSRFIDSARVSWKGGERTFVNSLGVGFDVTVLERLDRTWGRLGYAKALIQSIQLIRGFKVVIRTEQELWSGECMGVVLMLGAYTGGGMRPSPDASFGSGELHVTTIAPLGPWGVIRRLPSLLSRGLSAGALVRHWKTRQLHMECEPMTGFHLDGEIAGHAPLDVVLQPSSIKIAVSRGSD